MTRTGRSLLVAGLLSIASLFAAAASAAQAESVVNVVVERSAKPAVVAAPVAPAAPQEPKGVVPLPFRSLAPTRAFVDTAILRFVCPRSYSALRDGGEVACSEIVVHTVKTEEPNVSWNFQRRSPDILHTLELVAAPSPFGGYDLHLFGVARDVSGKEKSNPELEAVEIELEQLLKDLSSAPLGRPGDGLLSYQLSYVQADRAVAVLRTLGYAVVEYTKKADEKKPTQTVFDNIFEQIPALGTPQGGTLRRPVVIKLADSEQTSLVEEPLADADPELAGGQALDGITDAAPQQRLLIVHDENDPDSLDLLLSRLERQIDVAARQILIEALVIELDHDRLLDLGIEVEGKKDNLSLSFEREAGGLLQPLLLNFTRPSPRTLLDLSVRLRALVERGQATVLSRPSVFVLDGRQARIKVGENVPYTKKVTVGDGGLTIAETGYLKTGIILNLRPRAAFDNSDVTMQVEAIISSPGRSQVVPGLGALLAPNLQSRQIQTLVKVANDTPFVIGGLIAQNDQHSITGIPGLSNIRVFNLGALFRKRNASNDRREVIVVITPHIVTEDDPTYAYTIPRDAGAADARQQTSGASGRPHAGDASSCALKPSYQVFDPAIEPSESTRDVIVSKLGLEGAAPKLGLVTDSASRPKFRESIFDSLDPELFRSIYRLRGSDIFDLSFITDKVQGFATTTQEIAEEISKSPFSNAPRIDRADLKKEILLRLQKMEVRDPERIADVFLVFFEGGVPGQEILVHQMMIRVIEKLGFSTCVPADGIIYFPDSSDRTADRGGRELDPETLTANECLRSCLEDKTKTVVLAFPPPSAASDEFLTQCLGEVPDWVQLTPPTKGAACDATKERGAAQKAQNPFSPPVVRVACVSRVPNAGYFERLRKCNSEGWAAILLDREFRQRGRNSIGLLQSVLALERLLEINDSRTLPRTLRAFHVGRELVLPTREDLQTRRHLIDRETARRFYETLDYYGAFTDAYEEMTQDFKNTIDRVVQDVQRSPAERETLPE